MSNFSSLPTNVGLPSELAVSNIDPIMPSETKSQSIRVFAINNPTASATCATGTGAANSIVPDQSFPQTDINFDIPCSQSPSTWLDTRLSTLNFRTTVSVVGTAGTNTVSNAILRSSAYSFFDAFKLTGPSGQILEQIPELALTLDTILQGQLSVADREGLGMSMGFHSSYTGMNNTGHAYPALQGAGLATSATSTNNYSLPLVSGVIGVSSNRFFPIGLVRKLLATFTTASVLPITLQINLGAGSTTIFTVVLSDFWLNLETIDIGPHAQAQILSTLHDGKMYLPGQTYKTTTSIIPNGSSGVLNLPLGLTGSSVRSLFTRFYETGPSGLTTSAWGKYSSSNPCLNQYGFNIGGVAVPNYLYNPLLYPAQTFRSYLIALGSFNSTQFKSSITQTYYQRLTSNGTTSGTTNTTKDQWYQTGGALTYQNAFLLGENIEQCPRRGVISGRDLTFQKVNLVLGVASAVSNPVNVYVTALLDCITIVDAHSGECVTII